MKEYGMTDQGEIGNCFLIYGETGSGKTGSFITLPDPTLIISREPRDPRRTLHSVAKAMKIDIKTMKIDIKEPEGFDETIQLLDAVNSKYDAGKGEYKSICFDSLSFEQSRYKIEMEDSRYEKETELVKDSSKSRYETLVDRFRIERADWGSLGSMMKRITYLLNRISRHGVAVVATSTLIEHPKWDREISAAPAFQGVDYGSVFTGYFDFIGLVKKQEQDPYPPVVHFISDGSFVAKNCSTSLTEKGGKGVLDFRKILKAIEKDRT